MQLDADTSTAVLYTLLHFSTCCVREEQLDTALSKRGSHIVQAISGLLADEVKGASGGCTKDDAAGIVSGLVRGQAGRLLLACKAYEVSSYNLYCHFRL